MPDFRVAYNFLRELYVRPGLVFSSGMDKRPFFGRLLFL